MPSIKDRKELLRRIKASHCHCDINFEAADLLALQQLIPGCEFYDSNNINQWFKRNIEKHVKKAPSITESPDGQETLDPS